MLLIFAPFAAQKTRIFLFHPSYLSLLHHLLSPKLLRFHFYNSKYFMLKLKYVNDSVYLEISSCLENIWEKE